MNKTKLLCAVFAFLLCVTALTACAGPAANGPTVTEGPVLTGVEAKIEAMKSIKTLKDLTPSDGKKVKIAFIGDSITYGAGTDNVTLYSYPGQLKKLLGDEYEVGNFGINGAYALSAKSKYNVQTNAKLSYRNTAQYFQSLEFNPDVVVIMLGINDIRSMSNKAAKEELKQDLAALALEYCEYSSVQKVYIATPILVANAAITHEFAIGGLQDLEKEVAQELGLDVLDIFGMLKEYFNVKMYYTNDRVHPNKEIYGEMAKACYAGLIGESYTAPKTDVSDTGVVYVASNGRSSGKGASADNAINSWAKAVGLLPNGGTIVLCGPYDLSYAMLTPWHQGKITVTSSYGGVDYAKTTGASLGLDKGLYLNGDYHFENLTITAKMADSFIACNYNNVTFGKNITCKLGNTITTYPIIVAGYNLALKGARLEDISLHDACDVVIESGTWAYFLGGNRRTDNGYPNAGSDPDAKLNITINGGTFMSTSKTNTTAGAGMGGFSGTMNFTINGGTFKGDVYAVGRSGENTSSSTAFMDGTVNMTVTGGAFDGSIRGFQDGTTIIEGKINITLPAALKEKADRFTTVAVTD